MSLLTRTWTATALRGIRHEHAPGQVRSLSQLQELLGHIYRELRNDAGDGIAVLMDELANGVADLRAHTGADGWKAAVEKMRRHPLISLLHQDPFTHRGFHKPWGHAGDAVVLDYLYRDQLELAWPEGVTSLGAKIHDYTTETPLAQAIRNRRDIIAIQIDRVAEQIAEAEILALQSGHLREAALSSAVHHRALRRFVALDRDNHAVAMVEELFGRNGVVAINTPTYALLSGAPTALGRFDLIYSAGLFDELDTRSAVRAVSAMFAMLKPRGKICIANLVPGIRDAAYVEAFMNWWMVYRASGPLQGLLAELPRREVAGWRTFIDPTDQVAFLEVTRSQ